MPAEADRLEALAQELSSWGETRDLSGAMLLTRGGERILETCVGYADRATRTPVTPATRFGIASVTKMFTACAMFSLVREGLVASRPPSWTCCRRTTGPGPCCPRVTVHHLLCHTSGIADYCEEDEDFSAFLADYAELWRGLPSYSVTRPADFLPLLGELPPYRPPGERFQYSNAGFIVLGLVIEELTGQAYTEVVQQRVFDRAEMSSSGCFRLDEAVPDVAVGYVRGEGRLAVAQQRLLDPGDRRCRTVARCALRATWTGSSGHTRTGRCWGRCAMSS